MADFAPVEPIAGADFDRIEAIEDIEFGEGDAVDAGGQHGLAHECGVEPAATARTAGDDAEFLSALAQELSGLVLELGRKRPFADAGRIGLGDTQHVMDRAVKPRLILANDPKSGNLGTQRLDERVVPIHVRTS